MPEAQIAFAALQQTGTIRREKLFGREHIVVPTVAVQEMVLHNNVGAMFLPAEEIEASVGAWNFTPVTIGHPSERGQPVSARTVDRINSRAVGILMNARMDGKKLKADAFIDPAQAKRVSGGEEVIAQLERGEVGEVSTGFGGRFVAQNGTHDGQPYDLVARNIQPDHSAIGIEEGACSVADGCGLGVNSGDDDDCGCGNHKESDMDEETASNVADTLWDRLKTFLTKESAMNDERVTALHEATGLSKDRLADMEDEEIEALAANVLTDEGAEAETEDAKETANNETPDEEVPEWAQQLRAEVAELKESVEPAMNEHKAERERMVKALAANERCPFEEDELENRSVEELRKLDSMARNKNYAGRGGPRSPAVDGTAELPFKVTDWHQRADA